MSIVLYFASLVWRYSVVCALYVTGKVMCLYSTPLLDVRWRRSWIHTL